MKDHYGNLKFLGIIMVIFGLMQISSGHAALVPISIALGIILIALSIFKSKRYNRTVYSIIIVAPLSLMLIGEYFLVSIQNTIFYVLLLIMSMGTFLSFYFSLKPQNLLIQREKILLWTGSILFGISFFGLMGFIYNSFTSSLIIGAFVLIMLVVNLLIRRRIFKDALKNEFNEVYTTKDAKEYGFRYEIGGMLKPVRWQGWACYGIMFLSPLIVLISGNPTTTIVIVLAFVCIVVIIAMLKSNYRENIMEYRESLKK